MYGYEKRCIQKYHVSVYEHPEKHCDMSIHTGMVVKGNIFSMHISLYTARLFNVNTQQYTHERAMERWKKHITNLLTKKSERRWENFHYS